MNLAIPVRGLYAVCLTVCLLGAICDRALAVPNPQKDSNAAEKIRQQVEKLPAKERLRVKLQDTSERRSCLQGTELDGFFIGPTESIKEKVLYVDVAAVKSDEPRPRNKVLRGIIHAGAAAVVVFGLVKIGSNTPKTVVAKIYLGSAIGYGIGHASPRPCR